MVSDSCDTWREGSPYFENLIEFGGGQRSSGVTRGQNVKTFRTVRVTVMICSMWVASSKSKNPIDLWRQRSSGVTRGQTLKILQPRYLQNVKSDSCDTWHVGSPYCVEEFC